MKAASWRFAEKLNGQLTGLSTPLTAKAKMAGRVDPENMKSDLDAVLFEYQHVEVDAQDLDLFYDFV